MRPVRVRGGGKRKAALLDEPRDAVQRGGRPVGERGAAQHEESEGRAVRPARLAGRGRWRPWKAADAACAAAAARRAGSRTVKSRPTAREADQPERVEAHAPAEARRDPSGHAQAERGADGQPGIVDAGGQAETARRERVAQHRQGRRRERGLANADQHARQGQMDEAARRARQRRS